MFCQSDLLLVVAVLILCSGPRNKLLIVTRSFMVEWRRKEKPNPDGLVCLCFQGDSGGPLVCQDSGFWTQIGQFLTRFDVVKIHFVLKAVS